jgi:hypothetical protein
MEVETQARSARRPGRPQKQKGERRNRYVSFWITEAEDADLRARAATAGMTPGTFARAATRSATIRVVSSPGPAPELVGQIRRLGITADQSLKAMRGGYYSPSLGEAATEAYREASALLRRLFHGPEC